MAKSMLIRCLAERASLCGTQGDRTLEASHDEGAACCAATPGRPYIVLDALNREECLSDVPIDAVTAYIAVILIEANQGISNQTRWYIHTAALMGIRHIALVIHKADWVALDASVFTAIDEDLRKLTDRLHFDNVAVIPLSLQKGDEPGNHPIHVPWYGGPTLMGFLDAVEVADAADPRFVFVVQEANLAVAGLHGVSGCVRNGHIALGDKVRVTASGRAAHIKRMVSGEADRSRVCAGDVVTLVLDEEVGVVPGDVLAAADSPLEMTDHFEATLIWLHKEPGLVGRGYEITLLNQRAGASITSIKHRIDVATDSREACRQLEPEDIAVCNLALNRSLVFDAYHRSRTLGHFMLEDRFSQALVALGVINHSLRCAQNVHRQALSITQQDRELINGHPGKVIWLTGLSGSGKSTIANALEKELYAQAMHTYILDGDNVRLGLNKDLGFTDADRVENIRRVAEVAKLMLDAGLVVMTAFISPFRAERDMARQLIGEKNFIEVFVDTPLAVCEQRDPKGLYKKARSGLIPNMTGINSPYERPENPEVVIDGTHMALDVAVEQVLDVLLDEKKAGRVRDS